MCRKKKKVSGLDSIDNRVISMLIMIAVPLPNGPVHIFLKLMDLLLEAFIFFHLPFEKFTRLLRLLIHPGRSKQVHILSLICRPVKIVDFDKALVDECADSVIYLPKADSVLVGYFALGDMGILRDISEYLCVFF